MSDRSTNFGRPIDEDLGEFQEWPHGVILDLGPLNGDKLSIGVERTDQGGGLSSNAITTGAATRIAATKLCAVTSTIA